MTLRLDLNRIYHWVDISIRDWIHVLRAGPISIRIMHTKVLTAAYIFTSSRKGNPANSNLHDVWWYLPSRIDIVNEVRLLRTTRKWDRDYIRNWWSYYGRRHWEVRDPESRHDGEDRISSISWQMIWKFLDTRYVRLPQRFIVLDRVRLIDRLQLWRTLTSPRSSQSSDDSSRSGEEGRVDLRRVRHVRPAKHTITKISQALRWSESVNQWLRYILFEYECRREEGSIPDVE